MADEIERKFLVPAIPDRLGPGARFEQGYLAIDGAVEVRIRRAPTGDRLTVKTGSGLVRTEVELPLSTPQADALWSSTAGRRIEKVRHRVDLDGGHMAEVDVYAGALAGLCTAEVEFPTAAAAERFDPPAWMGDELTGQPGWSNADLARHGRPPSLGS